MAGSAFAARSVTGASTLVVGLAVFEAVDELATALAELGLASTGLGATSVAELGLATSDPVTGLALASSGLRTFSTGAAGLAGSTVSAAT